MKMFYKIPKVIQHEVVSENIVAQDTIPVWAISKTRCDYCGFEFDNNTASAIKLESGKVMIIHSDCHLRADKELNNV